MFENENYFYKDEAQDDQSKYLVAVGAEKAEVEIVSSVAKMVDVLGLQEMSTVEFLNRIFTKDELVICGSMVIGKGINMCSDSTLVYINKNSVKLTSNIEDTENELKSDKLDMNKVMLVVNDDADDIYMAISEDGSKGSFKIFHMDDSVTLAIYFETKLYKGRGRYYGCVIRDARDGFKMCNISPDPRTADFLFNMFESVVFS